MTPVGVDVSKDFVDIAASEKVVKVPRKWKDLQAAFSKLPKGAVVVMEATGKLHRMVVEVAISLGLDVRLVNPYAFSLYRKSLTPRAKNDRLDALALRRYAEKESDRLRPIQLPSADMQRLKDLHELRETQLKLRVAWQLSLKEFGEVPKESVAALKAMEKSLAMIEKEIYEIASKDELYARLLEVDGIGEGIAPALVWLLRSFDFSTRDEIVAFVGLDVRVRESGRFFGQRKLTKRGPAFLRRLLHCGANSLRKVKDFKPLFEKHHNKGLKTTAVNVIFSRKILATALALQRTGTRYDRAKHLRTT